jgi:hypothetical protein
LAILLAGAAAAALMTAEPAPAIFINNNFDPNAPPVLAGSNEFPNVLLVGSGNQSCTGTLISPTQVLTAAHCFFSPTSQPVGRFIGTQVNVESPGNSPTIAESAIIINPGFDPKRTSASSDIAIVVLSSPINNLTPVNLQTTGSPLPPNTPVYIVGYGKSGRANGSDQANDGERRIAQTLIGGYLPLNQLPVLGSSSNQTVYAAQFRDPENQNQFNFFRLTAAPPEHEGGTASGDSGGPLFICPKGNGDLSNCSLNELVEIGTLIGGGQPPPGQPPTGGGSVEFGYGDISAWTSLLVFADWVNGNGFSPIITAQPGNFNWSNTNAWANGMLPASTNVAWLSNPGTITLDLNTQVSALWVTGQQSQLVVASPFTLTATTNTILSNGILTVNGTLNTPSLGITGGVLNGTGTITAPGGTFVNNSAGTIAPGTPSAVGTLTIAGDYSQGPSGTLQIRLASTGSDRLAVTGEADLGGTLVTLLTSSPLTRRYTVLHADGGLGGLLSTALRRSTCQPAFLKPSHMTPTTFS